MHYKKPPIIALKTVIALIIGLMIIPASAQAQALTEANIRNLYREFNAFYQTPKVKIKPYIAFLEKYYAEDGAFKFNVTDSITKQHNTVTFSKDNLIITTQNVYSEATIDKAFMDVKNVRVTQNPKIGIVEYYFLFEGTRVQTTQYGKKMPYSYQSLSHCKDLLQERNGVLTIYKSICDIEAMNDASALAAQKPKANFFSNFTLKFKDFIKY